MQFDPRGPPPRDISQDTEEIITVLDPEVLQPPPHDSSPSPPDHGLTPQPASRREMNDPPSSNSQADHGPLHSAEQPRYGPQRPSVNTQGTHPVHRGVRGQPEPHSPFAQPESTLLHQPPPPGMPSSFIPAYPPTMNDLYGHDHSPMLGPWLQDPGMGMSRSPPPWMSSHELHHPQIRRRPHRPRPPPLAPPFRRAPPP